MVGHSITRAPRSSRLERNSAAWEAARVMTTVLPLSAIQGDLGKNVSSSHREQLLTKLHTEFGRPRIRATQFVGNNPPAIETRDQSFDAEPISLKRGFARNRHLATPAQRAKETALGRDGRPGGSVIQNFQEVLRHVVG